MSGTELPWINLKSIKEDKYTREFEEIAEKFRDEDPSYLLESDQPESLNQQLERSLSNLNKLEKKMLSEVVEWTKKTENHAKPELAGKIKSLMRQFFASFAKEDTKKADILEAMKYIKFIYKTGYLQFCARSDLIPGILTPNHYNYLEALNNRIHHDLTFISRFISKRNGKAQIFSLNE
ncbi:hypothetical protein PtA15_8A450 [Puccinia triticina]|uniref:Uncharacterized protein n=1 Tax=Puccinia triticina TaxID=208348 RepID=A0ABY7CQK4_9BASI|nr:uncharacterized protein PtA15_8A450 [Puccinia triticina]WAQ87546.1 hypothetical protein PtA15_8A450 [Puccinia triticina]